MATPVESDDEESVGRMKASLYDETIDVPDAEEVRSPTSNIKLVAESFSVIDTPPGSPGDSPEKETGGKPGPRLMDGFSLPLDGGRGGGGGLTSRRGSRRPPSAATVAIAGPSIAAAAEDEEEEEQSEADSDEDEDDDDDEDVQAANATLLGSYDPSEFNHLPVSADIKELFQHITRYTPQTMELDYKLKPFVPDFIPAVGDIDAFLKVARPDTKEDGIGLRVLDEPCANQSEPAVLHLQLRAVAKQSSAKAVVVKKVESAERNAKAVDRWIKDISDLHRSKPPPTVHYTRPMPDVDTLMQEWPSACEQRLREAGLPSPDVDCDLTTYVDVICSLFDIPVYESRIESLHVLFSLFSAVRNSQLFSNGDGMSDLQN